MPNSIIKDGSIVDDQWQLLESDETVIPDGPVIIPLSLWEANKDTLADRDKLGIWLNSDQSPTLIAQDLGKFSLVAVNFPAFADGRGFSYGRELRDRHNFQGEVRAIGDFIADQLLFLKRCGFNAFALKSDNLQAALKSFNDFTDGYQSTIDQPTPLFNRR